MKKTAISLLSILLTLCLLAGCGGQENTPAPSADTISVTIMVECKTAVDYGNELAASISENGVILAETEMKLEKGTTALDALKQTSLVVDTQSSSFGQYVQSIQSLKEQACGGESGWMYFVNGESASVGCDSYILEDGDAVQWRYSCNYGEDL